MNLISLQSGESIKDAVAKLTTGGTVQLSPGTYNESSEIRINGRVAIVGQDLKTTKINISASGRGFFVPDGSMLRMSGITLAYSGSSGDIIHADDGEVMLSRCVLAGSRDEKRNGCAVRMNGGRIQAEGCFFLYNQCGLGLASDCFSEVKSCMFQENIEGAAATDTASAAFNVCMFVRNMSCGASLLKTAGATFSDCSFAENAHAGITVFDSSAISLVRNKFENNGVYAVAVYEGGGATIAASEFTGNNVNGIRACGSGLIKVSASFIKNNKGHGVEIHDAAKAELTDCVIEDNGCSGIGVFDSSEMKISGCTLAGNASGDTEVTKRASLIRAAAAAGHEHREAK